MLVLILQAVAAAMVWTVANSVYLDINRKRIRGFTRVTGLWTETPTIWLTFFMVPDSKHPTFHPPPQDGGESLLTEIRCNRERREISGVSEDDHRLDY